MLRLVLGSEFFNEETSEFVISEEVVLEVEHSLASLSKWESKWEVPFLGDTPKTEEQTIDYVKMMIIGEIPPEKTLEKILNNDLLKINEYISAKMTATWFSNNNQKKGPQPVVTAEIIYYWMISFGIPFECQYWHLNKLLTLIEVCQRKNAPKTKMSRAEVAAQQRALNEQRRKQYNTTG